VITLCCNVGVHVATTGDDVHTIELDSADDDLSCTLPSSRESTDSSELTLTASSHHLSQVSNDDNDNSVTAGTTTLQQSASSTLRLYVF